MIIIDGSYGEGGGQILRSAIALSIITNKPIEINNIRAKRSIPGLRPQHLSTIKILAELSDAEVSNLSIGSTAIRFKPKEIKKSYLKYDVGSAGSISLILQALIPAISLSNNYLEVELIGGTDVKWSPTIDYMRYIVKEAYNIIGIDFDLEVIKRGYYPKGNGIVRCIIKPAQLRSLELLSAPRIEPKIISIVSMLPKHVAERQISAAITRLEKEGIKTSSYSLSIAQSASPGSSILIYATSAYGPFIGGDSIGEKGKSAESVGLEASERFIKPYINNASIDKHLADMIVLPLSLSNKPSRFITDELTLHLETNLHIIKSILGSNYSISKYDSNYLITINPSQA